MIHLNSVLDFGGGGNQRCQTRTRVMPYSQYYKVYNSSCSQVGYNLIDHVQSLPVPIKVAVSICKHVLCDDEGASSSGIYALIQ